MVIVAALIVAAAIVWMGLRIADAQRASGAERTRDRQLRILATFAPGISAAAGDPRAILVWEPLARAARQVSGTEFTALDRAAGGTFPFSNDRLQMAHARWTTDWLAWEGRHDAEFKLRVAASAGRAQTEAIEAEKLEQYQRHYEEYITVARGLQRLIDSAPPVTLAHAFAGARSSADRAPAS